MSNSKFDTLASALLEQRKFSDLFYNLESLSEPEREDILRQLALCAHTTVSDIVTSVNFKSHVKTQHDVDHARLLYKSVDLFRYTLAILNLWNIDPERFISACNAKNDFLHMRHNLESKKWQGQDVVVFDCDDVIAQFRSHFDKYLHEKWEIKPDAHLKEYYNAKGIIAAGLNPDVLFKDFLRSSQMLALPANKNVVQAMRSLKDKGYWIQILTARPAENLDSFYDTFSWFNKNNIPCDAIDFSPEKYRWLSEQKFYMMNKVVGVIDDSPKHAAEFSAHGVKTIMPAMPYNDHVEESAFLKRVDLKSLSSEDICSLITQNWNS